MKGKRRKEEYESKGTSDSTISSNLSHSSRKTRLIVISIAMMLFTVNLISAVHNDYAEIDGNYDYGVETLPDREDYYLRKDGEDRYVDEEEGEVKVVDHIYSGESFTWESSPFEESQTVEELYSNLYLVPPIRGEIDIQGIEGDRTGWNMTAGDFTGSGYDDLVVGSPGHDSDRGAVYIFFGHENRFDEETLDVEQDANVTITGPEDGKFGASLANISDWNENGIDDLAIASPGTGEVYVFHGMDEGDWGSISDFDDADETISGDQADDFASSVAGADLKRDGTNSLIIGAPGWENDRGKVEVYHSPNSVEPDAELLGKFEGDRFGHDTAGLMEVSSDGGEHTDLIVGAPYARDGEGNEIGRAFVFFGREDFPGGEWNLTQQNADVTLVGEEHGDRFGWSVFSAGDVNNNTYGDIVVGAPGWQEEQGRAYVYLGGDDLGSSGGDLDHHDYPTTTPQSGDGSEEDDGLEDEDGEDDEESRDTEEDDKGSGSNYSGTGDETDSNDEPTEDDEEMERIIDGASEHEERYGWNVTRTDMTGNGYNETIIGAPYNDHGGTNAGAVYIFFGFTMIGEIGTLDPDQANVTIYGETAEGYFGWDVDGGGSVNGTEYEDLIIGEPGHDNDRGRAHIFYGDHLRSAEGETFYTSDANVTLIGEAEGDRFGQSVAMAGDTNGNGFDEVVVGAPYNDNMGNVDAGAIYILEGNETLTGEYYEDSPEVTKLISRSDPIRYMGFSVASAGDVNGDGFDDIIVGAPGVDEAYVYHGSETGLALTQTYNNVTDFEDGWHYRTIMRENETTPPEENAEILLDDKGANDGSGNVDGVPDVYDDEKTTGSIEDTQEKDGNRWNVHAATDTLNRTAKDEELVHGEQENDYRWTHEQNESYEELTEEKTEGGRQNLFYDGFESGDFDEGGWDTSENPFVSSEYEVYEGDYSAGARRGESGSGDHIFEKSIDTSGGYYDITLDYAYFIGTDSPGGNFDFIVEWYDSATWETLFEVSDDSPWTINSHILPEGANNNTDFKIRFIIHLSGTQSSANRAWVDEVFINATQVETHRLEHKWEFDIPESNSVLFDATAYHTNLENDDFTFYYSFDGTGRVGEEDWTEMFTVDSDSPHDYVYNDDEQDEDLNNHVGTIYVGVKDTDRSEDSTEADTLYVDYLSFECDPLAQYIVEFRFENLDNYLNESTVSFYGYEEGEDCQVSVWDNELKEWIAIEDEGMDIPEGENNEAWANSTTNVTEYIFDGQLAVRLNATLDTAEDASVHIDYLGLNFDPYAPYGKYHSPVYGFDDEITSTEVSWDLSNETEDEGEWHWLYPADHRATADTGVGINQPIIWYGAIVLDLSDYTGNYLSEVAYNDHEASAEYVRVHVAEEDGGAPGEWLASSEKYTPTGAGWLELELDSNVPIEEPGEYWIVMEVDDYGDDYFPCGVIEPEVDDGQWLNMDDPHDPDDWQLLEDQDLDYSWALEALVNVNLQNFALSVSADGGENWEEVPSSGSHVEFSNPGTELQFKAEFWLWNNEFSAVLHSVTLTVPAYSTTLLGDNGTDFGWSVSGGSNVDGDDYDDIAVGAPVRRGDDNINFLEENFDMPEAEFPPNGWDTDDWSWSDTDNAGGTPPEARLYWFDIDGDYSYLLTPPKNIEDFGELNELVLDFKSSIDHYSDEFNARVLIRENQDVSWADITPWENPVTNDIPQDSYQIDILEYQGVGTQIMFEFEGTRANLDDWWIDEVYINGTYEHPQGRAYLFKGTGQGVLQEDGRGTANATFTGSEAGDQFGYSVDVGDVNVDGYGDVIIGAPYNDMKANDAGAVYVYNGTTGLSGSYTAQESHHYWYGPGEDNYTGFSVAHLGYIGAVDPIAVGSPGWYGWNGNVTIIAPIIDELYVTFIVETFTDGEVLTEENAIKLEVGEEEFWLWDGKELGDVFEKGEDYTFDETNVYGNGGNTSAFHRWIRRDSTEPFDPEGTLDEIHHHETIRIYYYEQFEVTFEYDDVFESTEGPEIPVTYNYTGEEIPWGGATLEGYETWADNSTEYVYENPHYLTPDEERLYSGSEDVTGIINGKETFSPDYYHQWNVTFAYHNVLEAPDGPDIPVTYHNLSQERTWEGEATEEGNATWVDHDTEYEYKNPYTVVPNEERWYSDSEDVTETVTTSETISPEYHLQYNISVYTTGGYLEEEYSTTLYWDNSSEQETTLIYDDLSPIERWMDYGSVFNVTSYVDGPDSPRNYTYICDIPQAEVNQVVEENGYVHHFLFHAEFPADVSMNGPHENQAEFGHAVSGGGTLYFDPDYGNTTDMLIGAPGTNNEEGAVYLFAGDHGWEIGAEEILRVDHDDHHWAGEGGEEGARYGHSVFGGSLYIDDITYDAFAAGAPYNDSAYVYSLGEILEVMVNFTVNEDEFASTLFEVEEEGWYLEEVPIDGDSYTIQEGDVIEFEVGLVESDYDSYVELWYNSTTYNSLFYTDLGEEKVLITRTASYREENGETVPTDEWRHAYDSGEEVMIRANVTVTAEDADEDDIKNAFITVMDEKNNLVANMEDITMDEIDSGDGWRLFEYIFSITDEGIYKAVVHAEDDHGLTDEHLGETNDKMVWFEVVET